MTQMAEEYGEIIAACFPCSPRTRDGRDREGWSYHGTCYLQYRYPENAQQALRYFREVIPRDAGRWRTFKLEPSSKEFYVEKLLGAELKFTGPRINISGIRDRMHREDDEWHTKPVDWGWKDMPKNKQF